MGIASAIGGVLSGSAKRIDPSIVANTIKRSPGVLLNAVKNLDTRKLGSVFDKLDPSTLKSALGRIDPTRLNTLLKRLPDSSLKNVGNKLDADLLKKMDPGVLQRMGKKTDDIVGGAAGRVDDIAGGAAGKVDDLTKKIDDLSSKINDLADGKSVGKAAKKATKNAPKSVLKKMAKPCMKNPGKCAAGVAAASYVAYTFGENTMQQRECIAECLPENWPYVKEGLEAPLYHEEDGDEVRCTADDGPQCDAHCKAKCEAKHPTTLVGVVAETVTDGVTEGLFPFMDALGFPMSTIMAVGKGVAVTAGLLVVFFILGKLLALKRMIFPPAVRRIQIDD